MKPSELKRLHGELTKFGDFLTKDFGRPERCDAMRSYVTGLLLDGDRKSVQPMAARLAEHSDQVEAIRQRLQQCVVISPWSEQELFGRLARKLQQEVAGLDALVIDDTGFPKKGRHSVGVARQYSGTLGRTDNCQVAVSLHLAGERESGCIGMRLYMPQEWMADRARCQKAGMPEDVVFQTKWEIALDLLAQSRRDGVEDKVVLADAGYGDITAFRDELDRRDYDFLLGISGSLVVWRNGEAPRPAAHPPGKMGRPRKDEKSAYKPVSIKDLAKKLSYRKVTWRGGSKGACSGRFAATRVNTAHKHGQGRPPGKEVWLLCEWRTGEAEPTKFYLSSLPSGATRKDLVRLAKTRWRVERDYQEMKEELGLDHFEGRTWRGFHHHAALCAAAHTFLTLRRALFPPEQNTSDRAVRPA